MRRRPDADYIFFAGRPVGPAGSAPVVSWAPRAKEDAVAMHRKQKLRPDGGIRRPSARNFPKVLSLSLAIARIHKRPTTPAANCISECNSWPTLASPLAGVIKSPDIHGKPLVGDRASVHYFKRLVW